MSQHILNDSTIEPTEESIFKLLGKNSKYWKQLLDYLYKNHTDISEVWKYYNDGKSWLFRVLKKKKTVCWMAILSENTFQVGFWFSNKAEPVILSSDLPDDVKKGYLAGKKTKIGRGIGIIMNEDRDFENVVKVIELKMRFL
jgi:hypothetical protein